jgi:hypothetical protein
MSQSEGMIVPRNGRVLVSGISRNLQGRTEKNSILELQSLELNQTVPKYEAEYQLPNNNISYNEPT